MNSVIKIFQRKDGSLLFCASCAPIKAAFDIIQKALLAICRDGDKAVIAPNFDFQFFNISDSQLKEMEIKPEPPAEPK